MQKCIAIILVLLFILNLSSCSNITDKEKIIGIYQKNESAFADAASAESFTGLEDIRGVQRVSVLDTYVDITFGGNGIGPGTHYYGIFYYAEELWFLYDDEGSSSEWNEDGTGYRFDENSGDNRFYIEPLGNGYFYYEAHF